MKSARLLVSQLQKTIERLLFMDTSFVDYRYDREILEKLVCDAKAQAISILPLEKIEELDNILENRASLENKCNPYSQYSFRKKVAKKSKAIHTLLMSSIQAQLKSRETEICFLLCCLFPKGCAIDVEMLLRFTIGLGLGLYPEATSIEQVRCKVWEAIEDLKACSLLLEHQGKNVKMHEAAYKIGSIIVSPPHVHSLKRESRVDIEQLRLRESKAMFTTCNRSTFEILLFGDDGKISRAFLESTDQVRKFLTRDGDELRVLHLEYCQFVDIRSLTNIEILSFRGSDICELPSELGSLHNLKMLDVYNCQRLHVIPANLIQHLYMHSLEELCIGGPNFKQWPFEVARQEGSTSEMSSLPFLPIISLSIPSVSNPRNIIFPKLQKYEIAINDDYGFNHCYPISRALKVANFSLTAVKELLTNVQHLHLDRLMGYKNLLPSSDMIGGLNELTFLSIRGCPHMENIVDTMEQHVPDLVLSELKELIIEEMDCLRKLCNGSPQRGFLHKLKKLKIINCPDMIFAVPAVQSLEELRIKSCDKLQEIFQNNGQFHVEQKQAQRYLELIELPELSCIWSRSFGHVSLHSLKDMQIKGCNGLTSLFSLFLARSLVNLHTLKIQDCSSLMQVVKDEDSGVDEISVDTHFSSAYFPSLAYLEIVDCNTLEYVFQVTSAGQIIPQRLSKVRIENCSKFQAIFQNDSLSHPNEEKGFLISCLTHLELIELPELSHLWSASHPRLRYVLIQGCHKLTFLFSLSLASSLEQLETLKIHDCRALKRVVSDDDCAEILLANPLPWPSLKFVEIADCPGMEYIFQVNSANLPQLEELDISGCQQLKQVLLADAIELPLLRSLLLQGLKNLSTFSSGNTLVKLPSLQTLRVEASRKLANFTISFEVSKPIQLEELCLIDVGNHTAVVGREMQQQQQQQPNLEYLTMENNNEEIFLIQGGCMFWDLKKLILKELSKLQFIWKHERRIVRLTNLTHLELFECNKLTSIFSVELVPCLWQLTYLKVQACDNLEHIISRNQSFDDLDSTCFPRLTEISIADCNMLKTLFPFRLTRLPSLKKLMVKDACRLKQIFQCPVRRIEDENDIVKIKLKQLEELSFQNLPEFLSFTTLGYYFVFPCLKSLEVIKCDKMAMRFITYHSNPPRVRAQIEESLWPSGETTESEYINPQLPGDIKWRCHEQN